MSRRDGGAAEADGPPWYREGLRFTCTACGACCTGAPGYVWIGPEDVERMAKALGLSPRRFLKTYTRKAKGRLSLKERESGDCILLRDGKCTVYDAKPTRCSTFPFWSEVVATPEEWAETKLRCEGIDRGALYTRGEIERLVEGDAGPLLEKQAAGAGAGAPRPDWDAAFRDLEALYADLEAELPRYRFTCAASGKCCDFDAYGHRLYVTTLEAAWFSRHAPAERANDDERQCPAYGKDRLCHAREGRMLGCRAYFCGPYPVIPPDDVYERYHRRLVQIHERHGIEYAYRDVIAWAAEARLSPRERPQPVPPRGSCS